MLQMVSTQWGEMKKEVRVKLPKSQLEDKAMVASLACFLDEVVHWILK